MRRSVVAFVVISIAAGLMLPAGILDGNTDSYEVVPDLESDVGAAIESLLFPSPVNTSQIVPEYSTVSRALMLPGGSTYATLADINRDGRTDLIVAVSEAKVVSVFYRQSDGDFTSFPSHSIVLGRSPIGVATIDPFSDGKLCIAVVERRDSDFDTERLVVLNYSSDSSYYEFQNLSLEVTASSFVIGSFNGDAYPDMAYSCPGLAPTSSPGTIRILFGPVFSSSRELTAGRGANSIVAGNFSSDGLLDLAVTNYYDRNVLVFHQPFLPGNTPNQTLTTSSSTPQALASGDLSNDGSDDIAVAASNPSRLLFYFQSMGSLQTTNDTTYSRLLTNETASSVYCEDFDGDGRKDLVMLSTEQNRVLGISQRLSFPVWPSAYDFVFPTGDNPRHALIGNLDADSDFDIAVSSARADWSGSSIAVYPARTSVSPRYLNANATIWGNLNWEASSFGIGDVDGDGLDDFVVLYPDGQSLALIKQPSGVEHDKALGFVPAKMIVSELNGDAYCDVLVTRSSGNSMSLYFGQPDLSGSMQSVQIQCSANITDAEIGLLNDDLLADIVTVTDNGTVEIFFNTGSSVDPYQSAHVMSVAPGVPIPAVVVGDFNPDERDDIAYSLPDLYIKVSFQMESSPFFVPQANASLYHTGGGIFSGLWAGDVNGDSKIDIAAMKASDSRVFLFNQDHFMTSRAPYSSLDLPEAPKFVSVSDFTDDGHADLVATFDSADLMFLYRQSAGQIPAQPSMVFVTGARPNCAVAGTLGQDETQSMIVSDSASHSFSIWRQVNLPPVADAGGPYSGMEGYEVSIVGSVMDSASQIPRMMYRWDFGDGNSTDWQPNGTITHRYLRNESYILTLEVKDPGGKVSSDTAVVDVVDSIPLVDFEWSPAHPVEGQEITFVDNTSSYDDVTLIAWSIDGQTVSSGMDHSISRTLQNGTYAITLEEHDDDGSMGALTKYLTVLRSPPQVVIVAPASATEDVDVKITVYLDPWHSGLGDTVQSYEWDFSYEGVFILEQLTVSNWTMHSFTTSVDITVYTVAVRVTDNDGDQAIGFFNISIFDETNVSIVISSPGPFYEFDQIDFTAVVESSHPATLFEWEFESIGIGTFVPDESRSDSGNISHVYGHCGNFLLQVRATVSNGSTAMGWLYVTVLDVVPAGTFEEYVTWERNAANTSQITLDASALAAKYPDIAQTIWDFGDGETKLLFGTPVGAVVHYYVPSRNYDVVLNVTDDDGTTLSLVKTLRLSAPSVLLISPAGDSVIKAGVPVRFLISDDSPPMSWVQYTLNGGAPTNFTAEWEIGTAGWTDGAYSIVVRAADADGNIAVRNNITIIIDDLPPDLSVLWKVATVYGGDSMNISVQVTDPHIDEESVFLYIKFPGSKSYSQVLMNSAGGGTYYAVVEIPRRSGTISFNVTVEDLAQNSASSEMLSVSVKLHFIDMAWPYLLALVVLAALGTAGYFVREVKIAVDETFVIYNDGRLIAHSARHLKPGMDDQVLSGMFVAIQDFVKESFKDITSFTLRKLEFGEKSVLIEKGDHLFLAVILHGKASKKVVAKMQRIVDEIEEEFSSKLKDWDGDLDALRGVGDIAKKLYSKAPLLPPFRRQDN